jgi:hypothetical protein
MISSQEVQMMFRVPRWLGPLAIGMLCGCMDSDPNPNGPSVEPRGAVKAPTNPGSAMQPQSLSELRRQKLQEKEATSSGGPGPAPASAQ